MHNPQGVPSGALGSKAEVRSLRSLSLETNRHVIITKRDQPEAVSTSWVKRQLRLHTG